jgi:uncharacterized protein YggE
VTGRRLPVLLAAVTAAVAAAAVALVVRPGPAGAAPEDPVPTDGTTATQAGVEVGGVGTATGTPDVLRVTVGAEVTAETVDAALRGADDAARKMLRVVRDAGVADRDVQTVNVSVYPTYGREGERITGYISRHDLEVTLRDMGEAGAVIGRLADAGGDAARVQGISYVLEDDAALQEQARADAFADARRKAEQYAELAGRELGEVVSVRENVTAPGPMPYAAADSAAGASEMAIAPGSTTVTVTAEVRWSLR